MSNTTGKVVILGTGGTIAGRAERAGDNVGYTAGQVSVADLISGVPSLASADIEYEQVAQLDSKDMDFSLWQRLAARVFHHSHRDEVAGLVITHGTDTLEETAWFLHCALPLNKPVVLTCAMRPTTALSPDGPQNLADAVTAARDLRLKGVVAVCAGQVHAAEYVTKTHSYRTDAFDSPEAGPVAVVEEGVVRMLWPHLPSSSVDPGLWPLLEQAQALPRVEIVFSHADAHGAIVTSLLQHHDAQVPRLRGLVVAGTGNGTVHHRLTQALQEAQAQGIAVWWGTRCARGRVVAGDTPRRTLAAPSVVKARISLAMALLAADQHTAQAPSHRAN